MGDDNRYIRFDWAVKNILRDKANFGVLEGLIEVLTGEPVTIVEILESEGNQKHAEDKFNRVDIKAKNDKGHLIIVEVQLTRQLYFLQRMLYGVAKAVTEHIKLGDSYDKINKVYSINILYCDLGEGKDYVYKGIMDFRGIHTGDSLMITKKEKDIITYQYPSDVFPEYFLIRVNNFDKIPQNPLDEWVEYLKTGNIRRDTKAPGLREAGEKLQLLNMTEGERIDYERHLDAIMVQNDVFETAVWEGRIKGREEGIREGIKEGREEGIKEGREEGIKEGREEGIKEGRAEAEYDMARKMLKNGLEPQLVASITGLSLDIIESL